MSDDNSEIQKRIILINTAGRVWSAEFEGRITRRDISRLSRVLTVEFAKVQRRRSVEKLRRARLPEVASTKEPTNEVQSESTANKEPENVRKPE